MNRLNYEPEHIAEGHHILMVDLSGASALPAGSVIHLLTLPQGYKAEFVSRETTGLKVGVTINVTRVHP